LVFEPELLEWTDPSSFPEPVYEWWKGQKQILFYETEVSGLKSIALVMEKCQLYRKVWQSFKPRHPIRVDPSSLRQVLGELMAIQTEFFERHGALNVQYADAIHNRFDGQALLVKCYGCHAKLAPVKQPSFTIYRPGYYVCRSRISCSVCKKRQFRIPRDHENWVYPGTVYGQGEKVLKG